MLFNLRKHLGVPVVLLAFAVAGCDDVSSPTPILAVADADAIPLRDGFYFGSMTLATKTYADKVLMVNFAKPKANGEVLMKDLGDRLYLVQMGELTDSQRDFLVARVAADGASFAMYRPECNKDGNAARFARAGVRFKPGTCKVLAATPEAMVRAYREVAHALPETAWTFSVARDGTAGGRERYEQAALPDKAP